MFTVEKETIRHAGKSLPYAVKVNGLVITGAATVRQGNAVIFALQEHIAPGAWSLITSYEAFNESFPEATRRALGETVAKAIQADETAAKQAKMERAAKPWAPDTITIAPSPQAAAKGAKPQDVTALVVGALAIVRWGRPGCYSFEINHVPTGAVMSTGHKLPDAKATVTALNALDIDWASETVETVKAWPADRKQAVMRAIAEGKGL